MTGFRRDDDPIELVQLRYLEHVGDAAKFGTRCGEHRSIRCQCEVRDRFTFIHDGLLSAVDPTLQSSLVDSDLEGIPDHGVDGQDGAGNALICPCEVTSHGGVTSSANLFESQRC